ncbi:MAG: 2-oxoacid:acceptor oxidoreductase [Spirochaetes bacterium]|nr:MAG: 2-oxoacid:acceptor oxidoreductase [Spirochaetota bacterium]
MRGKPIVDVERCKGCMLCNAVCPENIMGIGERFNRQGLAYAVCVNEEACTTCRSCAIICPESAIRIIKYVEG